MVESGTAIFVGRERSLGATLNVVNDRVKFYANNLLVLANAVLSNTDLLVINLKTVETVLKLLLLGSKAVLDIGKAVKVDGVPVTLAWCNAVASGVVNISKS
jgi:hypothetical protein